MITPADWARIQALFHAALERPPEEREAFLRRGAQGNEEILREVESLLAAHPEAEGFLSVSPVPEGAGQLPPAVARGLAPGSRLGVFEILGPLGAGGMGAVHRARDTRLDRTVAIKVLSPELVDDPQSRDRFEREARLVSKLSHPHICTLHDVGSAVVDGHDMRYLVMELLQGETLASRLKRGALPLDQALRIALEVADALAAAHALGIVHRDLKPANIMLTKSGVKLLDFGLARLRAAPDGAAADDPVTIQGLVLGTIPYMAPEQLRGEEVDARADLFAFGAVLYEMVTGRRAFAADSEAALIAAILERNPPPVTKEQPLAPPALDRLVAACLAKDPQERWQHAQDLSLALDGISQGRVTGDQEGVRPSHAAASRGSRGPRRLHAIWAAAVVAAALLAWGLRPSIPDPAPAPNPRPVVVLMDSPLAGRVYDPRTLAAGGTNADDVSDVLRDLAVVTYKENTSAMWHREEQVRAQNPDLVVSHLSCLLDQRVAKADAEIRDHLFDIAQKRLTLFFGYLGATNPRTRFLVYSRSRFSDDALESAWIADVVGRFPSLKGRIFTMVVPGGERATFRDPETGALLRARVKEILALP